MEINLPPPEPGWDESLIRFQTLLKERRAQEFLAEFQRESDRAAAVLGAAYLSQALEHALRMRLLGDKSLKDALFGPDKPLGSFSARIKVALAVGLLAQVAYNDLEIIRRIRNDFAHKTTDFSFERPDVATRCRQLGLAAWFTNSDSAAPSARILFNRSVAVLATVLLPAAETMIGAIKAEVMVSDGGDEGG